MVTAYTKPHSKNLELHIFKSSKMPPDTIWSYHLDKSAVKLSVRSVEWKNLMSECLMATQIKRSDCIGNKLLNPNDVMNARHQMAKECFKATPPPRSQMKSEAMKVIREENSRKLLKMKEDKLIKEEIGKLKQILEVHEVLRKRYLNAEEKRKRKQGLPLPKICSKVVKLRVLKTSGQSRVGKVNELETSERRKKKETKRVQPRAVRRGSFQDVKEKVEVRIFDENFQEDFVEFLEKAETGERERCEKSTKPLDELVDTMNRKRLERAWRTWRNYIQRQRKREREKKMYVDKIEAFLRKLNEPERETETKLRITTCKHERKKFKLPERAKTAANDKEREEKLRKLMREVKTSQTEAIQRLRSRNESLEKAFPDPKFLFQMEERHEERLKRWKQIQERKQKLKEEKEKEQKRIEEEEKQRIKQEKQKRMEELKERRRAEKERKEEQRKRREKARQDELVADAHYRKFLLGSFGLRPWVNLMKSRRAEYERAVEFHERRLLLTFYEWRISIREEVEKKRRRAEQLYNQNVLERCWGSWVNFRRERMKEEQAAVDWNEFKIVERMFRKWMCFTENEQLEYLKKIKMAESHRNRILKVKCIEKLRSYPEYKKEEREREMRKFKMRQKVKEILPDYQPVDISQY